ncbi:MAG TPA: Gldg family protein [Candidatus Binatia bacterium]|nr:Gldg family protein [Candidatus Binatia bacterium]
MPRLGSFYGVVGVILLLFAGVAYFITRLLSAYVFLHALFGLLAIIVYLASAKDTLRTFLGERSTKYGASAALYTVLFFAILAVVNYLSARHHHRFDLTEAGVYSLSPQSRGILQHLDKPLVINAFVEAGSDPQLKELLDSYRYASDKISYAIVDPDKQPDLAERFHISAVPAVHLQYGDHTNVVNKISEEELTNGIIKVTRAEKKTVYFLEGHGEPSVNDMEEPKGYGQIKTSLDNESYEVKTLVLSEGTPVPDDANLLIVAGAERSLLPHEIQAIDAYLKKGGHALFLLNPRVTPELATYLQQWGVQVGNDVIVDEQLQLLRGRTFTLTPFVTTYGSHPITEELSRRGGSALTTYGISRSVEPQADGKKGLTPVSLAKTGPNSWAETDLEGVFQKQTARLDEHDRKGPISLAVAVTANLKDMGADHDGTARLVVFGDAVFADNQYINQYFNRDLLLNTVGWLVGEEGLISVRPRTIRASRVQFTAEQGTVIFYLSVLILPELLLIAGLAVWWQRR